MRLKQLAFAVLGVLRHHGAVQVEVDGVERAELREVLVEQRPHLLVGILGDVGSRRRRRPGERHDLVAELGQALHGAGDRDVEAFDAGDHLRPAQQRRPGVGAHELLPGRLLRREGIGLVLKATHSDSRHEAFLPFPTFSGAWTISPTCAKSWLLVVLLASSACGTASGWQKPGTDQSLVDGDLRQCRRAAVQETMRLFADWRPFAFDADAFWNWRSAPATARRCSDPMSSASSRPSGCSPSPACATRAT